MSDVMGLREKKKLARHREILMAAAAVFRQHGYDDARVDEIAARADVSPGTVYNYFPAKDMLLLELVAYFRSESDTLSRDLIENAPADPLTAFSTLYSHLIDQSLKYLDKSIWRHVQVATILGSWDTTRSSWWNNEAKLIDDQRQLLRVFKTRGTLPADFDEKKWSEIIHSVGYFLWQRFLAREDQEVAELKHEIGQQLACILPGPEKRKASPKLPGSIGRKSKVVKIRKAST